MNPNLKDVPTIDLVREIERRYQELEQARKLLLGGDTDNGRRKRTMSREARDAISKAQRRIWAQRKKSQKS